MKALRETNFKPEEKLHMLDLPESHGLYDSASAWNRQAQKESL